MANETDLGCAGKEKTAPQVFLTVLWHMGLGVPWDYRVGPGTTSERAHLKQMVPDLPPEALVVADAGFVGYGLCLRLLRHGKRLLLRVGGNITLLTGLGTTTRSGTTWCTSGPRSIAAAGCWCCG